MRVVRAKWDGADPADIVDGIRATAPPSPGLAKRVAEIIAAVRERGDDAFNELIVHLDGVAERPESHRVPDERLAGARDHVHRELIDALELAAANVRAVGEAELEALPVELDLLQGQRIAVVERLAAAAGVYAPGGRVAYPLLGADGLRAARAAGVKRLALATPPEPDGSVGQSRQRPLRSPEPTRCTRSAARTASRRWRSAPRRSTLSTSLPARGTPGSPRRSASSTASWASTGSQDRASSRW